MSSWGGRLFAACFGIGLVLITLEVGVRVLAPQPPLLYRPDAALGWVHEPGLSVTYPGHSGPVPVRFNSRGLRDTEHETPKPDGAFRILVLGDSYPEAVDVELDAAFPKQVEQLLREHGVRAEVINAGVGGYGTDQAYLYYRQEGRRYEPDVVLLAFTIDNDVHDNLAKGYCRAADQGVVCARPDAGLRRRQLVAANAFLQRHFQSYFFLREHLAHLTGLRALLGRAGLTEFRYDDAEASTLPLTVRMLLREPDPELERGWRLTLAILDALREAAASEHARVALLIVPGRAQVEPEAGREALKMYGLPPSALDLEGPNRRLLEYARGRGLAVADPTASLRGAAADGIEVARGHWTAEGHRLAAAAVVDMLERSDLLPPTRGGADG